MAFFNWNSTEVRYAPIDPRQKFSLFSIKFIPPLAMELKRLIWGRIISRTTYKSYWIETCILNEQ